MKGSLTILQTWIAGSHMTADTHFSGVSTDSRSVPKGSLFIALRGERFDAHDFLQEVVASGAAAVVVEHVPAGLSVPALVVPDTRAALGDIARQWRRQFAIPVIGVTGSNGKTTVKEMIAAIFQTAFGEGQYLATRGNLNNDVGVPLTLLRLDAEHRAAVVELGMNHAGEIAQLASMASPTIGLVNNAQREHQEFMHSVEAVATENGAVIESLPNGGVAVFPSDDLFTPLWQQMASQNAKCRTLTFGLSGEPDVGCSYRLEQFGSEMTIRIGLQQQTFRLGAAGLHNVRNALAAAACCHAIGIGADDIVAGLAAFAPVSGRMQRKPGKSGARVIDDSYNANPDSVLAAINVLAQFAPPRVLVLGDMGEVGSNGVRFHEEVGAYARQSGIENLLVLGDLAAHAAGAFGAGAAHFEHLDDLMGALVPLLSAEATVLVKGSRFMQMERVVRQLVNGNKEESH